MSPSPYKLLVGGPMTSRHLKLLQPTQHGQQLTEGGTDWPPLASKKGVFALKYPPHLSPLRVLSPVLPSPSSLLPHTHVLCLTFTPALGCSLSLLLLTHILEFSFFFFTLFFSLPLFHTIDTHVTPTPLEHPTPHIPSQSWLCCLPAL